MAQKDSWITQPYQTYVLRCWQEGNAGWRFSLKEVYDEHRRHGFGDPETLAAFLRVEVMGEPLGASPPAPSGHVGDNARHARSTD